MRRITVASLIVVSTMFVTEAQADPGSRIAPIQSKPHGKSYGEWAARWWQWALEIPASVNPVVDTTGEYATVGQTGRVWFLAGAFTSEPVERSVVVPTGTALFFPVINSAWFAFLSDPEEQRTEEFIRAQAAFPETPLLYVEIDGKPIVNPEQYLEQSPLFEVQLPEDNVFGVDESEVPELLLSPSVDEGYYLFLHPLPPGKHTLRWFASSESFGFSQDITYQVTVKPGKAR